MADTLAASRQQSEEAIARLESERGVLDRELQRNSDTLTRLASDPAKADPGDLADLHERMGLGERRLTEIAEERLALARTIVSREEVAQACTAFDPLWDTLTIREQVHIVNLLIKQVCYDGVNGAVSITFHPAGIKTLASSQMEKNA